MNDMPSDPPFPHGSNPPGPGQPWRPAGTPPANRPPVMPPTVRLGPPAPPAPLTAPPTRRAKPHPARKARKVAAGISIGTFTVLAGGMAVNAAVSSAGPAGSGSPATTTPGATTATTPTGPNQGYPTDDNGSAYPGDPSALPAGGSVGANPGWNAHPGSSTGTAPAPTPSPSPNTQSHGS